MTAAAAPQEARSALGSGLQEQLLELLLQFGDGISLAVLVLVQLLEGAVMSLTATGASLSYAPCEPEDHRMRRRPHPQCSNLEVFRYVVDHLISKPL